MSEREQYTVLNKVLKKYDEIENKISLFYDFFHFEKNKLVLKGPVYYTQGIQPFENNKTSIGSPQNFVKNLFLSGNIVYPDEFHFGINNDISIDKMGKISFHSDKNIDSVSIFGLPSFQIKNVLYLGENTLFFHIDGSIESFISKEDILKIEGNNYKVRTIFKDKIEIVPIQKNELEINKEYSIEIFSTIFGCYKYNGEPIIKMNANGNLFYKTNENVCSINIGSDVYFEKNVIMNEVKLQKLTIENMDCITNLNAEYLGGKKAPEIGDIVSTKDNQVLWNKSFGDTLEMNKNRIMDMGDPLYDMDATTKRYVDRYLSGLKVKMSCKCATTKNINCDYVDDKIYWKDNFDLYSNFSKSIFDNYDIKINESVLVFHQDNIIENGVYIVISDGVESGRIILERRYDLRNKTHYDDIKNFYTFVENGSMYGGLGFVLEFDEGYLFHVFSKIESIKDGKGLLRRNNIFDVNVDDTIFIHQKMISIKDKGIDNHHLKHNSFHIKPLEGIEIDKSNVLLGDNLQISLKIDPNQFYFGKKGELKSKIKWKKEEQKEDINSVYHIQNVHQLFPPNDIHIEFQYSDDYYDVEKEEKIQYFISSLNDNGDETHFNESHELFFSYHCKSLFCKISFEHVKNAEGYKLYKKINHQYWFCKITDTNVLDVIVPQNFSKLKWVSCEKPENKNNTIVVINKFSTFGDNFITSGNLGLGITKPKELLHTHNGSLFLERNDKNEFIKMSLQGIYGERAKIIGETKAGNSIVELGKEIKMFCEDEGTIFLGRNENCDEKDFNEEIGSNDMTLQVKDGGIYIEGDCLVKEGKSFGTLNNKLGNNSAILRTGCVSNSIGNEISFIWEGDELVAVPLYDGNVLTRKKVQVKNFCIDHPQDNNKYLVHACLEGPTADVYYRGKDCLDNGYKEVFLPHYFTHLIKPESSTLLLTCKGKPFLLGGEIIENENKILVYGDGKEFYWEVKAERKDTSFNVEPFKTDVSVKNFGPYCFLN